MFPGAPAYLGTDFWKPAWLAGGAKEILGYCLSKPTPRGRDKAKKFPVQLMLDDILFK